MSGIGEAGLKLLETDFRKDILGLKFFASAKDLRPLQSVAKFPDIAWPVMVEKRSACAFRKVVSSSSIGLGEEFPR